RGRLTKDWTNFARYCAVYNGLLVLDKIYGAPSRACVNGVGAALGGRKQKTGHAGTLDTTASGALIVLAGYATRLSEAVMNLPKTYEAHITFGWETSTDDATGEPLSDPVPAAFDEDALRSWLPAFCGVRLQTPPRVSAVKVDGARAHKLARAGSEPAIRPRPVNVTSVAYLGRTERGEARLRVRCHRGTYVRSLARDLGRMMGLGAHLSGLRRLNVGCYACENAVPYNPQQRPTPEELAAAILPVETLATQYYSYVANAFCEKRLSNGLNVYLSFMRRLGGGVVPVSDGVIVLGRDLFCLGDVRLENGRAVVRPRVNLPRAAMLP
ncbi:MAG: tRNA pseudouridine(55) synthase TruB, partial [Pyramidobacter sp.]|nr:tRNA pseudouridine(55) synthase TruB [Pyramidobacter sp.]